MKTKLMNVTIGDLIKGYNDQSDEGGPVVGFDGQLNIRPAFQREFIYTRPGDKESVIHSIANNFPLNVMYWADDGEGKYEMLDGQQRTLSICKFCANNFTSDAFSSGNPEYFGTNGKDGLPQDERKLFLNYKLLVYHCTGDDSDKMKWFKTINIPGKQLEHQELLNAVYSCAWTTDARRQFSNKNAQAIEYGDKYLDGNMIRQDHLETAIKWIAYAKSDSSNKAVENHMSMQKKNKTKVAQDLWNHFEGVFVWVESVFPEYHASMKKLPWGEYYHDYHNTSEDTKEFAKRARDLHKNEDVKGSGVYLYLLSGDQAHLNVRNFDKKLKNKMHTKQKGICVWRHCPTPNQKFDINEMEADHIEPWREGGPTNENNCQLLCKSCNRRKSGR